MTSTKKYYWLKLKDDFFRDKKIKKLRRIAGGDTYTIIYLKMQLLSLKREGKLLFEGVEENFMEEIALEIDEEPDNVKVTMAFLQSNGLLEEIDADEYMLPQAVESMGSESSSAARMRKHRARKREELPSPEKAALLTEENNKVSHCDGGVTKSDTEKEIRDRDRTRDKDKELLPGAETASEPEEPPFICLTLNDKSEYPVSHADVEEYKELYPAVDIEQQLRNMRGWLNANPAKRKTKSGIKRFINSWLSKEQDKGGSAKVITVANTGQRSNNRALQMLEEMGEI